METLVALLPLFLAMFGLVGCSAFFSASEAALFMLTMTDRREMKNGSTGEKAAIALLEHPERLLSSVLFCNLLVNVGYFSLASVCSIRMERASELGSSWAIGFTVVALLILIIFAEMLAKSVAVITPRWMAKKTAFLMHLAVRLVEPLMPVLRQINLVSTRIIWPGFKAEPLLDIDDLEQAIELTHGNASLLLQEQAVLQNMVQLSEIRIEEWMRPRAQLDVFSPPVAFVDLAELEDAGGYILISEPESEEIEKTIRLADHFHLPERNIEKIATPVMYLPWSASVAYALEKMTQRDRNMTAVVNEYGETIGILTVDDILETLFTYSPSRVQRLLGRQPLVAIEAGKWLVHGLTNLRILARHLDLEFPPTNNVTVSGLVQDQLQRLAEVDDQCTWGPFQFRVVETARRGSLVAELTLVRPTEGEPS